MDARDFMRLLLDDEVWLEVQQMTPEELRSKIMSEYGGCERVVDNGHAPARCVKPRGHRSPHAFDCDIDGEVLYPRKSPVTG